MNRHVFRPAHLHLKFEAQCFEQLITALYFKGDVFLTRSALYPSQIRVTQTDA